MNKCHCCKTNVLPGEYCSKGCDRPIRGQCEECDPKKIVILVKFISCPLKDT